MLDLLRTEESITMARSPSYPQIPLERCIELVRNIYSHAHRAALDSKTLIEIAGYSPKSGSGLAALSALKQFQLLEGRDEDVRVTELALKLLEPLNSKEFSDACKEAALSPPLFAELHSSFSGRPVAASVIRSLAVRNHGFTSTGADRLAKVYLETIKLIQPSFEDENTSEENTTNDDQERDSVARVRVRTRVPPIQSEPEATTQSADIPTEGTVLKFKLTRECEATVSFSGDLTELAFKRLISHLELSAQIYQEE